MKNSTKRLIVLLLSVAGLYSYIAFSADGKDLHNPNDPIFFWSGGQPIMVPLPILEQSLSSSTSREEKEQGETLLRLLEQRHAGPSSRYELELVERLRREEIVQPVTSSSTSSSSRTISKRKLEREELLKNKLVIPVFQFVEDGLSAKAEELKNVGVLEIVPELGVRLDLIRLISLIEKYFPNIVDLSLSNSGIGDGGFTDLAASNIASQLEILSIMRCGITKQSFTIGNLNKFKGLKSLGVGLNRIGDGGFTDLAASNIASQLERLSIIGCGITKQSFTVENLNRFKDLRVLGMSLNRTGDEGFVALSNSALSSGLIALSVAQCGITEQSFTVENMNRFGKIAIFDISGNNNLGPAAFEVLRSSVLPHRLQKLDVQNTNLPPNALDLLRKAIQTTSRSTSSSSTSNWIG